MKNVHQMIMTDLNINSLKNNFELLADQIKKNVNVLVVSETKLNDSFLVDQFKIPGNISAFCIGHNQFSGSIMVFVREDISSKFLSIEYLPTKGVYIELNLCKKKWLQYCFYNPNKNIISKYLDLLRCNLNLYSANYDYFTTIGDFNVKLNQERIKLFL